MSLNILDAAGTIRTLVTYLVGGNHVGATALTDATSGAAAQVANHTADNQSILSSVDSLLVGALLKIRNAGGANNFDLVRTAGADELSARGLLGNAPLVAQEFLKTTSSSCAAGTVTTTLSMTDTNGFQAGGTVNFEPGTVNYETALITAVVAGSSISVQFPAGGALYTHTASYTLQTFEFHQARQAPGGVTGVAAVSSDGSKNTYRYSVTGITPVATPTDFLVIQGSSSMTGRIKSIKIGGFATTAGQLVCQLIRRSTSGTAGSATLSAITPMKHDTNDAAPTLTVSYVQTANYSVLGTTAHQGGVKRLYLNVVTTGPTTEAIWDFARSQDKAVVLRGVNDYLWVNFNGATLPTGTAIDLEVELEEDES